MIKLNRLLRRTAVRLLCLVAALIALSPSAGAAGDVYLKGFGDDIKMKYDKDDHYTHSYTASSTGTYTFSLYDGNKSKEVGAWNSDYTVDFSNNKFSYGTKWYDKGSTNHAKFKLSVQSGYTYEFSFYSDGGDNKQGWLEISRSNSGSAVTTTLPCVPARVTNRKDAAQWAQITSTNPVVYLLANILNGERPSPEWEMISNDGGKTYILDFTARNSTMVDWRGDNNNNNSYTCDYFAKVYDSKTSSGTDVGRQKLENLFDWNDIKSYDTARGRLYPGRRYRATYDREKNQLSLVAIKQNTDYKNPSTGTLDVDKNYPPFMSLVGYYFKQTTEYTTPNNRKNTDGWQEAWIQFDKDGHVALDMKNKAMYNTMWPPKYPVYFYVNPNNDGNYVELSSERLQMNPQTTGGIGLPGERLVKKGSEWKELLKDDENYNGLFDSRYNGGAGQLNKLRDNDYYVRYVATNVWVLGTVKIWTGWGGTLTQNGKNLANWSNHANWGIGAHQDSYPDQSGQEITKGQPWNLVAQRGNFKFDKPTFFKTVELFYCVEAPDRDSNTANQKGFYPMYDRCIFYTTEGFGNPKIDARSRKNFTVADYDITVENVPTGCTIQSYTVTRYDATTGQPCTVRREPTGKVNAKVISDSNKKLSETDFNKIARFVASPYDNCKEDKLADGKYYYELTVTFVKPDGATATETVTSPIVTILNPEVNTRLLTAQLFELTEAGKDKLTAIEGTASRYNYMTYSETLGTVYGVSWAEDEIVPVPLNGTLKDYDVIYSNGDYGRFTDMVILSSPLSSKFSVNSDTYPMSGVGTYTLEGAKVNDGYAAASGTKVCGGKQDNGSFREIRSIDLTAASNAPEYNVLLDYTYYPEAASGVAGKSKPEQNSVYLTVPEPRFKEGKIDMKASEGFAEFSYGDLLLSQARSQTMYEYMKIDEPNVTDALNAKIGVKDISFKYVVNGKDALHYGEGEYVTGAQHPSAFTGGYNGVVKCVIINTANIPLYDRWKDGEIKSVVLTDDAPNTMSASLQNYTLSWKDVQGGTHLIEDFWIKLGDGGNSQSNGIKGGKQFLHHDSEATDASDWYYVTLHEYDPVSKTTNPKMDVDGTQAFVFSVADFKNSSDGSGARIHVRKDHGHWYENIESALSYTKLSNNLRIRVSHLYPFDVPEHASGMPGMQRTAANYGVSTNVLKSKGVELKNETPTSVGGVFDGMDSGSVKAGVGFIEVSGDGVEIYNASGVAVAAGEGRHEVPSGVYVVRLNGRAEKVIVR